MSHWHLKGALVFTLSTLLLGACGNDHSNEAPLADASLVSLAEPQPQSVLLAINNSWELRRQPENYAHAGVSESRFLRPLKSYLYDGLNSLPSQTPMGLITFNGCSKSRAELNLPIKINSEHQIQAELIKLKLKGLTNYMLFLKTVYPIARQNPGLRVIMVTSDRDRCGNSPEKIKEKMLEIHRETGATFDILGLNLFYTGFLLDHNSKFNFMNSILIQGVTSVYHCRHGYSANDFHCDYNF